MLRVRRAWFDARKLYTAPRPSFKLERGGKLIFYTAVVRVGGAAVSRAAEAYVETCTHPQVTKVAREVLAVLARLIPEGETTTPLIGMGDLATRAQLHRRTVWKWLELLVTIGEVRVVGGLPGRAARYSLVYVAGVQPLTEAPLPLVGAAAPKRPRMKRPLIDASPGLFDALSTPSTSEDPAINRSQGSQGSQVRAITWITRITGFAITWITRITGFAPPLAGTRARATYYNLRTTTTTPALPSVETRRSRDPAGSPPCRWFGKSHAWCEGRQHVPTDFHLEERRKLARHPGETDADLDAQLFARYAEILAAIPETEKIHDKNEFVFWNRVMRSAPSATKARAPTFGFRSPVAQAPRDGVTGSNCAHEPRCIRTADCLARTIAEARAERQEQSG